MEKQHLLLMCTKHTHTYSNWTHHRGNRSYSKHDRINTHPKKGYYTHSELNVHVNHPIKRMLAPDALSLWRLLWRPHISRVHCVAPRPRIRFTLSLLQICLMCVEFIFNSRGGNVAENGYWDDQKIIGDRCVRLKSMYAIKRLSRLRALCHRRMFDDNWWVCGGGKRFV